MTDKREVFHHGQEEVHIISILDQFNRGEAQEGYARDGTSEVHPHRLDAEVVEEAGQGVSLLHPLAEGEEAAVTTVNVDMGTAVGEDVCYQTEELCRQAHSFHCLQEEGRVNTVVHLSLIQAYNVARGPSLIA